VLGEWSSTTLPELSAGLHEEASEVGRAVQWLHRYEMSFNDIEASNGQGLIRVNLLAAVLESFSPLVSKLTPKSELPKNISKMLDGATLATCGEESPINVQHLPQRAEGPRDGVKWAFFEFEFAVMCLAAVIHDLRESCGIVDGDDKSCCLHKIQRAEKSGALSTGCA